MRKAKTGKPAAGTKRRKLTDKQRRFVDEYLIDLNATRAAKTAGYAPRRAAEQAYQLLQNPTVQKAIRERQSALQQEAQVTQERVLKEYARIAFLDPRKLYDAEGSPIPVPNLPEDVAAAIGGVKVRQNFMELEGEEAAQMEVKTTEIKIVDKKGALDSLSRHLGLFHDKLQVKASISHEEALDQLDD